MSTFLKGAAAGALGGLAGAAAMAATAKLEQGFTRRPSSYVPAHTLAHLLGRPSPDSDRFARNMAMHYGTGALLGALRGVWAAVGLRGPRAHLAHTATRLSFDQTVENATGVGAPPRTWPVQEQAVDIAHKAVYSIATCLVAERLVAPGLESRRGTTSH